MNTNSSIRKSQLSTLHINSCIDKARKWKERYGAHAANGTTPPSWEVRTPGQSVLVRTFVPPLDAKLTTPRLRTEAANNRRSYPVPPGKLLEVTPGHSAFVANTLTRNPYVQASVADPNAPQVRSQLALSCTHTLLYTDASLSRPQGAARALCPPPVRAMVSIFTRSHTRTCCCNNVSLFAGGPDKPSPGSGNLP